MAAALSEQPDRLPPGFEAVYCTDDGGSAAVEAAPIGNLLVDSVAALRDLRSARASGELDRGLVLGLLPGSRPLQLRHYLTRVGPVVDAVARRVSGATFLIARSPLVDDAMVRKALSGCRDVSLVTQRDSAWLVTGSGRQVPLADPVEVLGQADCPLSTPGTNTGEAAALGIPHLVVAPFDPSLTLLTGPLGLIERSPWPGRLLKRRARGGVWPRNWSAGSSA